jgi:hypothetical protein
VNPETCSESSGEYMVIEEDKTGFAPRNVNASNPPDVVSMVTVGFSYATNGQ